MQQLMFLFLLGAVLLSLSYNHILQITLSNQELPVPLTPSSQDRNSQDPFQFTLDKS